MKEIEEELRQALIPYCVELGYIKFDKGTVKNGKITANSEIADWKVLDIEQDSAMEYLETKYPNVDKNIIKKVIFNNTIFYDQL